MADSVRQTSLQLSADELRQLTGWKDAVIYEFLSLQAGVQEITQNINVVINNTDMVLTLESQSTARVTELSKQLVLLQEALSAFDAVPTKVASMKRDLQRTITNNHELLSALNSLITKVASNKRDTRRLIDSLNEELMAERSATTHLTAKVTALTDQIASLSEQLQAPDLTLLSRITRNADALLNLQQEMAGS